MCHCHSAHVLRTAHGANTVVLGSGWKQSQSAQSGQHHFQVCMNKEHNQTSPVKSPDNVRLGPKAMASMKGSTNSIRLLRVPGHHKIFWTRFLSLIKVITMNVIERRRFNSSSWSILHCIQYSTVHTGASVYCTPRTAENPCQQCVLYANLVARQSQKRKSFS